MSFHFQLEGLLRVRHLLEQQARKDLDNSMMRIRSLEQTVQEASQWIDATLRASATRASVPATELQFIDSILRGTKEAIVRIQFEKQCEEERADNFRNVYLEKRSERKVIATLRADARQRFELEHTHQEQSRLDEAYLAKMIRSRNSAQAIDAAMKSERDQ